MNTPNNFEALPLTNKPITQYRVTFTQPATTSGNVEYGTQWFDSLEETEASKWMNQENAKIVTCEYQP